MFYYGITHCLNALRTDNDSALESGVDEMVEKKFGQPAGLKYGPGSTASGSDHRVIPEDEGGTRDDRNRYGTIYPIAFTIVQLLTFSLFHHRLPKAGQFKGTGGPEDDVKVQAENQGGDQDAPDLQDLKRHGVGQ